MPLYIMTAFNILFMILFYFLGIDMGKIKTKRKVLEFSKKYLDKIHADEAMGGINEIFSGAIDFAKEMAEKEKNSKKKISQKEQEELMEAKFKEVKHKKDIKKAISLGKLEALKDITEELMVK